MEKFDGLLKYLEDEVITGDGNIWNDYHDPIAKFSGVVGDVGDIVGVPLPGDWKKLARDLDPKGEDTEGVDTYVSFLHCPKDVSNGGQKTSATGLAKAVGTESALAGMEIVF